MASQAVQLQVLPERSVPEKTVRQLRAVAESSDVVPVGRASEDPYEVESSGFHLEVSATLKALELSHALEEKCEPFYLDITTSFAQINAMPMEDELMERRERRLRQVFQLALGEQFDPDDAKMLEKELIGTKDDNGETEETEETVRVGESG
jgi:hypothetical protein